MMRDIVERAVQGLGDGSPAVVREFAFEPGKSLVKAHATEREPAHDFPCRVTQLQLEPGYEECTTERRRGFGWVTYQGAGRGVPSKVGVTVIRPGSDMCLAQG